MLRSIAKLWIHWCCDHSSSDRSSGVAFPRLLQVWIDADPILARYCQSLERMTSRLSGAAQNEVSELGYCRPIGEMHSKQLRKRAVAKRLMPQPFFVFAGALGLALSLGWCTTRLYFARNGYPAEADSFASNMSPISREESRLLVASTMEATSQLADRISSRTMALQSKWVEMENSPAEAARDTAKRGLRFVTQKIPSSAAKAFFFDM
jgi:hypothetical protein